MSLLEVLLASSLGLLVTGMLVEMYVPSMWLWNRQQSTTLAQQQAVTAFDVIRRDFLNTLPQTLAIAPDRHAISWRSADLNHPFTTAGAIQLRQAFQVYLWDQAAGTLLSTEIAPSGTVWDPPAPLGVFPTPSGREHVVARYVSDFTVGASADPLRLPIPMKITISPPKVRTTQTWTLQTRLSPRVGSRLPPPEDF